MKKLKENIDIEKLLSAVAGIVALVAIFYEMKIAGFDSASIAGGVKDIAGTVIAVIMLIVAVTALKPSRKKVSGFDEMFRTGMNEITKRYSPIIESRKNEGHLYFMAAKLSAIKDSDTGDYHKFFELTKRNEIEFNISKTVFVGRGGSDELFEQIKAKLVETIKVKLANNSIVDIEKSKPSKNGIIISFSKDLESEDDAKALVSIVDKIILLYIIEYKKS